MPDPNASQTFDIFVGAPGANQVFNGIITQINEVTKQTISSTRAAISSITELYGRLPPVPSGVRPGVVSDAIGAMDKISSSTRMSSKTVSEAMVAIRTAVNELIAPFANAGETAFDYEKIIGRMPPVMQEFVRGLIGVDTALMSMGATLQATKVLKKDLDTATRGETEAERESAAATEVAAASAERAQTKIGAFGETVSKVTGVVGGFVKAMFEKTKALAQAAMGNVDVAKNAGMFGKVLMFVSNIVRGSLGFVGRLTKGLIGLGAQFIRGGQSAEQMGTGMTRASHGMRTTIRHSMQTTRALDIMSSAFQGVMLGVSLAQGNLIGLAMGLFFLRMSMIPVLVGFAGLTLAFIMAVKPIMAFTKALREAGRTAQDVLVKFSALANNVKQGTEMWAASAMWAIRYGKSLEDVRGTMVELWQQGLMNEKMMQAATALSSAWGMSLSEAANILADATGETERNTEALRKYDIVVDGVTKTTDRMEAATAIAEATLNRYGDAIEAHLRTISGASQRAASAISFYWEVLTEPIATNVIAPLINGFANMVASLATLVGTLWQSAKVQSYYNETLDRARAVTERYRPEITLLGNIVRVIVVAAFWALQAAMRAVVVMAERFFAWLRNLIAGATAFGRTLKPVIDMLRMLANALKTVSFTEFLQRIKDFFYNLPILFGLLGPTIGQVIEAVYAVWLQYGERAISNFLIAFFSARLWTRLMPNVSPLRFALRVFLFEMIGRTIIELIPDLDQPVRDLLNNLFDWAIWSAIATPILVTLGVKLAGLFGSKVFTAGIGATIAKLMGGWWGIIISGALGIIVGILDEKLGLGIHDWIQEHIPQSFEDWKELWNNTWKSFNEVVVPFVNQTLPQKLSELANTFATWIQKPWDFSPWTDQFQGAFDTVSGWIDKIKGFFSGGIGISLPEIKLPEIKFPEIELPDWLQNIINEIGEAIKSASETIRGVKEPIMDVFNSMVGAIESVREKAQVFRDLFSTIKEAIVTNVGGWLESIKSFFAGFFEGSGRFRPIIEAWGPVFQNIAKIISTVVSAAIRALGGLISFIVKVAAGIIKFVIEIGKRFWELFTKFIKPFVDNFVAGWKLIQPVVKAFWNIVSRVFRAVGQIIGGFVTIVVTYVGNIIDLFLTLINEGPEAARERFNEIVEQWKTYLSGWWDSFKETLEGIKIAILEFKDRVVEYITNLLEMWGEIWETIKTRALEIILGIAEAVGEWISGLIDSIVGGITDLAGKWDEKWGTIKEAAITRVDTTKEAIRTKIEEIRSSIATKIEEVRSNWSTKWEEIKTKAGEICTNIAQGILDKGAEWVQNARDKIQEVWQKFQDRKDDFLQSGKDLLNKVIDGVHDRIEAFKTKVKKLIDEGKKKITEVDWIQLGKNIVLGVVDGVSQFAYKLVNRLLDLAKEAWRRCLEWLGITSPSKRFMIIGEAIVAGMMLPLETLPDKVAGVMADVAGLTHSIGGVNIGVSGAVAGMPGGKTLDMNMALPASVGKSGGNTINVNIVVKDNSFGDTDPRAIGDEIFNSFTRGLALRGVSPTGLS